MCIRDRKWTTGFRAGSSNLSLVECEKILVIIDMIEFWLGVRNTASCCFLNLADWVNYLLMIIISSHLCRYGLHRNKGFLFHLCVYRVIFGLKFGAFIGHRLRSRERNKRKGALIRKDNLLHWPLIIVVVRLRIRPNLVTFLALIERSVKQPKHSNDFKKKLEFIS